MISPELWRVEGEFQGADLMEFMQGRICKHYLSDVKMIVQRSPLFCANIVKKGPGRTRRNSLSTAGLNLSKPGAHNKGDLCSMCA